MNIFTAVLLLALAMPCFSQIRVIDTDTSHNTGSIATNRITRGIFTNSASAGWVDVSRFENVGVQFVLESTSTDTSNVLFSIWKSIDRSHLEAIPFQTYTIPLTGTNSTTYVTNFAATGIAWIKFHTFTNGVASTNFLTNSTVWVFPK